MRLILTFFLVSLLKLSFANNIALPCYGCHMSNNSKSNNLHDQIFWYRAEPHGGFKLGSKEFWESSKDLNSDDEDDVYDPNASKKRLPGTKINVKKNKW